jgi:hypothetical protein
VRLLQRWVRRLSAIARWPRTVRVAASAVVLGACVPSGNVSSASTVAGAVSTTQIPAQVLSSALYRVVAGDTLRKIGRAQCNDPNAAFPIFRANRGRRQTDGGSLLEPDLIEVGWELVIVCSESSESGATSTSQATPATTSLTSIGSTSAITATNTTSIAVDTTSSSPSSATVTPSPTPNPPPSIVGPPLRTRTGPLIPGALTPTSLNLRSKSGSLPGGMRDRTLSVRCSGLGTSQQALTSGNTVTLEAGHRLIPVLKVAHGDDVEIRPQGFGPDREVVVLDSAGRFAAINVSPQLGYVFFVDPGLPVGTYRIEVSDGRSSAAMTVNIVRRLKPELLRIGRTGTLSFLVLGASPSSSIPLAVFRETECAPDKFWEFWAAQSVATNSAGNARIDLIAGPTGTYCAVISEQGDPSAVCERNRQSFFTR